MVFQPATFGRYVLLKRIAIGGMAEIFRAIAYGAEGFEKVVAIKRMLAHLSSDHNFVDMFINEAKLAASLNHANIVQIYDFGCIDNLLFLSMEYVHGKDTAEITNSLRLRKTNAPIETICHVFIEVLNGLHHAHKQRDRFGKPLNLVHRDMSPPNIIVSFDGEVKIADFGIAKATRTKVQTSSGVLKGKYSYMSPEQANGERMDHRTDLFSLGICFYEMLTLTEMFMGQSELETLRKVRAAEFKPLRSINPNIPESLEAILAKALSRNPDDRYANAAEWRDTLEKFLVQNNLRCSTSTLSTFMTDLFQDDIVRYQEQLAQEAQTAEALRPEALSIARLEATAAGELDTLVIEKEDKWPPGVDHLDQGSYAEEESDEENTIRVEPVDLDLESPRPEFGVGDDDEETQLLPELSGSSELSDMKTLEKRHPLPEMLGRGVVKFRTPQSRSPSRIPAPDKIVGQPVMADEESGSDDRMVTEDREPVVIDDAPEHTESLAEDPFAGLDKKARTEKTIFGVPLMYFLFGVGVGVLVILLITLVVVFSNKPDDQTGSMTTAQTSTASKTAPAPCEEPAAAAVDAGEIASAAKAEKPEPVPPPPDAGEKPVLVANPKQIEPPPAPVEKPVAPDKPEKPAVKEKAVVHRTQEARSKTSLLPRKKKTSGDSTRKRKSKKRRKRTPKPRKETVITPSETDKGEPAASRTEPPPPPPTPAPTAPGEYLMVDGVQVDNIKGLEKKLKPGLHIFEKRDKNGKVLKRWKVRVGEEEGSGSTFPPPAP